MNPGDRNAKLEPRYAGDLPFVIRINSSVPIPFISRTIEAGIPNSTGTSTDALNIANVCWILSGIHLPTGGFSLISIISLSFFSLDIITSPKILNSMKL